MLGDEQHAGGIAVEPVHQPRPVAEAVGHAGEHPVEVALGAGAALHGDTVGFVQHQHVLVLVKDHRLDEVAVTLGETERWRERWLRLGRQPQDCRHAHLLAALHARVGLRAPGVEPHLAGAQQLLQMPVGDVREMHAKPAVEAHAGLALANLQGLDGHGHEHEA